MLLLGILEWENLFWHDKHSTFWSAWTFAWRLLQSFEGNDSYRLTFMECESKRLRRSIKRPFYCVDVAMAWRFWVHTVMEKCWPISDFWRHICSRFLSVKHFEYLFVFFLNYNYDDLSGYPYLWAYESNFQATYQA